jgi:pimeloyl-ACP methyl ester carboxylesterase
VIVALALLAATVDWSFDRYAAPDQLIEVEPGRRINLRCEGRGSPTILLESGLGWSSLSWRKVQPRLAKLTRTCSYDRAGLGFSDPGPMPRRAAVMADDLERLVEKAGLKPPYLLVGNSLGGQPIRLLAFRRPEQVAGIVLADPYVEGQYPALARIEPSLADELRQLAADEEACVEQLRIGVLSAAAAEQRGCIAAPDSSFSPRLTDVLRRQRMSPAGFEAAHSESLMLETGNEQDIARERRNLSPISIIVLSAKGNYASPRFDRTRAALLAKQAEQHHSLAALSSRGGGGGGGGGGGERLRRKEEAIAYS